MIAETRHTDALRPKPRRLLSQSHRHRRAIAGMSTALWSSGAYGRTTIFAPPSPTDFGCCSASMASPRPGAVLADLSICTEDAY